MAKEARLAKRFGLVPVVGAANGKLLKRRLRAAVGREPRQRGELMRTASEAGTAFKALLRALRTLGPGLGCPYLG